MAQSTAAVAPENPFNEEWFWQQVKKSERLRFTVTGVYVDPEFASFLTTRNEGNRALTDEWVARLASDMQEGRWEENGETIKFAKDGYLNDGQHRLYACAMHVVPFVTDVAFGVTRESRYTVDQGKRRSTADILTLRDGVHHSRDVAAAIRILLSLKARQSTGRQEVGPRFTNIEVASHYNDFPGLVDLAGQASRLYTAVRRPPRSVTIALMYLFNEFSADDSTEFWRKLETGLDLSGDDDPIYALRRVLIRLGSTRFRLPEYDMMALVIKAWNAFRQGKPIKVLAFKSSEGFPEIV
jgi:hypothetical protein